MLKIMDYYIDKKHPGLKKGAVRLSIRNKTKCHARRSVMTFQVRAFRAVKREDILCVIKTP